MTTTVNGNRPAVTVGDGLHGCVRSASGPEAADPGRSGADSTFTPVHVHAIPPEADDRQANGGRNFASTHAAAAKAAVGTSWPLTEAPVPLAEVARLTFPATGEAPNRLAWVGMAAAGMWRLAVTALGTLLIASVAGEPRPDGRRTRIRAGVSLALAVVAYATHLVARHIGG